MIPKKHICFFVFLANCLLLAPFGATNSFSQGTWTQKADFGGGGRLWANGFSIGTKGYIGIGSNGFSCNDFWEWDQNTNIWTQKANFPDSIMGRSVGFSIGNKGYFGTGTGSKTAGGNSSNFWEWNQTTNLWTQRAIFPGTPRNYAAGFAIGNNGYIGTGLDSNGFTQDFWEWNGDSNSATYNTWIQKSDLTIGGPRFGCVGFSINSKGYIGIGMGFHPPFPLDGFWEWDPSNNIWTQKANFPGYTVRRSAIGFSIGTKGYIGTGCDITVPANYFKDFWEWDQLSNTWVQTTNFGGAAKAYSVCFSIGTKGYVGTGGRSAMFYNDFWEFDPNGNGITENELENSISVYPNPFAETATLRITNLHELRIEHLKFEIYCADGKEVYPSVIRNSDSFVLRRDGLPNGVYFIHITSGNKTAVKKLVIQ